jgi:hypothetical protein
MSCDAIAGLGMGGISLILIERDMPGVKTTQMKCSGVWPSGTTYITFEDVKVPVENLIGKENEGFKYIMYNFNHERYCFFLHYHHLPNPLPFASSCGHICGTDGVSVCKPHVWPGYV